MSEEAKTPTAEDVVTTLARLIVERNQFRDEAASIRQDICEQQRRLEIAEFGKVSRQKSINCLLGLPQAEPCE